MPAYNLQTAYAWGEPSLRGLLKCEPEDFRVEEILPFALSGVGEHLYLQIQKKQLNTQDLLQHISRCWHVPQKLISVAGLKDKQAVTTQWVSVHLPGKVDPELSLLHSELVQVLSTQRHSGKLRVGALSENRFQIRLRKVEGDFAQLEQRCEQIKLGVPNYFGLQRFGHEGKNLNMAEKLFSGEAQVKDRHRRGLYLSAARSWLFNQILASRVADQTWNRPLAGDCLQLHGRGSFFLAEEIDATLEARCQARELHPTGALWGSGELPTRLQVANLEQASAQGCEIFSRGLEQAGLRQERRALRLVPDQFDWQRLSADELLFSFSLPAGAYATEVIRELVLTAEAAR